MARSDTASHESSSRSIIARWRAVVSSLFSAGHGVVELVATGQPATRQHHDDVRFELADVSSKKLVITGFGILFGMWVIVFILFFVYRALQSYYETARLPSPIAIPEHRLPPQPRIQISPRRDWQDELAYETAQLHRYSWVDRQHGIVTIPIERAMELIAQRGIPPQKAPPGLKLPVPEAGTRETGFEGKISPEPR